MARTLAELSKGSRIGHCVSLGVIAGAKIDHGAPRDGPGYGVLHCAGALTGEARGAVFRGVWFGPAAAH